MQWNLQSSLTCLQPKKHHSSLVQLASSRDTRRKSFGLTFYSLENTTHTHPLISRFVYTSTRRFYRLDQNKPEPQYLHYSTRPCCQSSSSRNHVIRRADPNDYCVKGRHRCFPRQRPDDIKHPSMSSSARHNKEYIRTLWRRSPAS